MSKAEHETTTALGHEGSLGAPEAAPARIAAISARGLAATLVYAAEQQLNEALLSPRASVQKPSAEGLQVFASNLQGIQNLAPNIALAVADVAAFEKENFTGKTPPYTLDNKSLLDIAEKLLLQGLVLREQFTNLLVEVQKISPDLLAPLLKNINPSPDYPATTAERLSALLIDEKALVEVREYAKEMLGDLQANKATDQKIGSKNEIPGSIDHQQRSTSPAASVSKATVQPLAAAQDLGLPQKQPKKPSAQALAPQHQVVAGA